MSTPALRPNLRGLSFSGLNELRTELHRDLDRLFDALVKGGCKEDEATSRIGADPFHDRLPYRVIKTRLKIEVERPE